VSTPSASIRIQLVRSPIGYTERQKKTVRALGLRRMNQIVERPDTDAIRGMVNSIIHLVRVVD
jgi:large subunit ribosomal protein L30